ncbi:MAG: ATP-dependent Clp protease ATP-binding subunit [Chloroflexi bacterium]|nr:ATP-dependent Clp protease ATP-binding subunit [Chloroflexota bacterium]MCC6893939.1 ATP-dependent Clp protease ATP-binding subunit [Anaerolineae bacterium]
MTPSPDIPEKEIRERCSEILSQAAEEARRLDHNYIGVEHLFMALTRNERSLTTLLIRRAGLDPRFVRNEIRKEVGTGDSKVPEVLPMTPRAELVLALTIFLSDRDEDGSGQVEEIHLLVAVLQEGESIPVRKLTEMGFDLNLWLQRLVLESDSLKNDPLNVDNENGMILDIPNIPSDEFDYDDDEISNDKVRDPARVPTPLLDKYGRDLTAQAVTGKIGPAIARESEIRSLARTLARNKKNNPLLLGDAGVGKTAVVEGLAYAIATGTAAKSLLNRRIVQIEIGTLVAGTSLRGQFEERLIGIVDEVKHAGNVIMFIDEIHTIVGAGDTIDSNLDAANILKPALARGDLMCIGATTHEEYRRAIAADPALDRRFRTIDIEEPSQADTKLILEGQKAKLEEHHGVIINAETLEAAINLSVRFLPDRRLPDKALDLLDEACTRVIIRTMSPDENDSGIPEVEVENVAAVLSDWTGIPVTELTKDEKRRLVGLELALGQRVIGQDSAVQTVAEAIKTARAGLGNPQRPIGVFLFVGPSGVGKTELARALASFLFGSDDAMLRLDMSEFHDSHTVARLIGAPPGYKDTQRGGQLTDGLRRRPYSVVLLDEVEKAAPEVFDVFLQVFDEGRLSDAHGRHVDARHSVFIMTSNIGTEEAGKSIGFTSGGEASLPDYSAYLKRFFRPEFLNRIDEVITFRPLQGEALSGILELKLTELYDRLSKQKLKLELTDDARALVLAKGYDAISGARPLARAIERLVTRPISAKIVEDAFQPGDIVVASADGERLKFEAKIKQG